MKSARVILVTAALLAPQAAHADYAVDSRNPYGAKLRYFYGEGLHPGIDFDAGRGTPVIAAADGIVASIGGERNKAPNTGGHFVKVAHGSHFDSQYQHLSQVSVKVGQRVKRGDLIGRSGGTNSGRQYLHFAICKKGGHCGYFSQTLDPQKFWLGGNPQCFQPGTDYSKQSQTGLTLPLACREHAEALRARH